MSLMTNAVLNLYAITLLTVLMGYSLRSEWKKDRQHRLYLAMVATTILALAVDILSRFDGLQNPSFPLINRVGNLLVFSLYPLLPSLWVSYAYCRARGDLRLSPFALGLLSALNAANLFMVAASQSTGWYYTIDAQNIYHRGPVYPFQHVITLVMVAWSYGITYRHRNNIDKRALFSLVVFPLPSMLGSILQAFVYGYAFALVAAVPALLIVLLYAQDDTIFSDYLTGVGNRKKLEAVLREKIARCSPRRTFSFVLLDVDHFKKINDALGHETGDQVLKAAANLLKSSVRAGDYVTRYGGDEFCLILDVSTRAGLDRVVERVENALEALHRSGALPCRLSFSMGCAVYDCERRPGAEEFLKRVDALMYENKRRKSAQHA